MECALLAYWPVPVKLTSAGLEGSESSTRSVAARVPVAVGLNLIAIVQLPFAVNVAPQLFVWEKSPGFVPVIVIPEIVSVPGPTFVRITLLAELAVPTVFMPKLMLVGLTLTMVPVPLRETVCGLLGASSAKVSAAVRAPAACGVNCTFTVHVAPAASVAVQFFDGIAKSAAFGPVMAIELMCRVAVPVFCTFTDWAVAVEKSSTIPKLIDVGLRFTIVEVPVPLKATL